MVDSFSAEVQKTGPEDNPQYDWRLCDRIYTLTTTIFTKRQCKPHERVFSKTRNIILEYPFNRSRLINERDALIFIAQHTTIPVPRVLNWTESDSAFSLTVEAVPGKLMLDLMQTLSPQDRRTLQHNVNTFLLSTVLPQLSRLRSKRLGQLSGVLIPPSRITNIDRRPVWEPKVSNIPRYVYCHNDLAQQNLMIDPLTLTVVAIIDWEYSGFFPKEFEYPFWYREWNHPRSLEEQKIVDEESARLVAGLDGPGELRGMDPWGWSVRLMRGLAELPLGQVMFYWWRRVSQPVWQMLFLWYSGLKYRVLQILGTKSKVA